MPAHQESRRARSARHYLINGPLTGRLETTLALVSRSMGFPVVRVDILDEDSQQSISLFGADSGNDAISRSEAFCDAVVRSGRPLRVEDAAADPRFSRYPAVIGGEFGGIIEDQLDLIRRLMELRLEGQFATTDLARATRDGEIVPWYQPVVDLATGETVAFEALARWEHPCGTIDDPRQFVPAAEDSDLIIELDLAVIRQALSDLSRCLPATPSMRMNVNLSARHFDHHDCAAKLLAAFAAAGVSPGSVNLELTETTRPTKGYTYVAGAVQQLRELGFGVWLDDFGTGWSSLDHLLWLRVDGIKIDRAVTVALGTPIGDALTRAVTGLANTLGLRTTIEGIETQPSAGLARAHGGDYVQGSRWAPPEPDARIDNTRHAWQAHPDRTGTLRPILIDPAFRSGTSTSRWQP